MIRPNLKWRDLRFSLYACLLAICLHAHAQVPAQTSPQAAGQVASQTTEPASGSPTGAPSMPQTQAAPQSPGEQSRQLAAPNGPPQPDPNQAKPARPAPGAAGVVTNSGKIEDQAPPATVPGNWIVPLRMYEGTWTVKAEHSDRSQTHTDTCQQSGTRFYECEHVIDGETIALLIFVPGDEAGHFYTQSVLPSGTALGRGDLAINGDTWIFNTRTVRDDGAVNYQRTTRVYSGRDKDTIHYQLERSDDGLHWTTTNAGVEKRKK